MTRKQLQHLISAGVFSAALLSGAAYADDKQAASPTADPSVSSSTVTDASGQASADASAAKDGKHAASKDKSPAQSGCAGAGGCGGGR